MKHFFEEGFVSVIVQGGSEVKARETAAIKTAHHSNSSPDTAMNELYKER